MGIFNRKKNRKEITKIQQPKNKITDKTELFRDNAEFCVTTYHRLNLDYTPESLKRIDEWLDDPSGIYPKNRFINAEFGKKDNMDNMTFTNMSSNFASYFGEVLRKNLHGQWKHSDKLHAWVVDVNGFEINVIHIAQECFLEPSKYFSVYQVAKMESAK